MNQTICRAISERRVVQFEYDGGTRVVEPHCHGVSKTGKEVLRGYQVAGYSDSGNPIGWKLFSVQRMSGVTILDTEFPEDRPDYNPHDSAMTQVHCCV